MRHVMQATLPQPFDSFCGESLGNMEGNLGYCKKKKFWQQMYRDSNSWNALILLITMGTVISAHCFQPNHRGKSVMLQNHG